MLLIKGSESKLKTLYVNIVSELMYYKKTRKDIEIILFEINLYAYAWLIKLIMENNIQLHGM